MEPLHITVNNFEQEVLQSDKPVLIDFWASWCGPCRMQTPVIEELSKELSDVKVGKINVDEEASLAAKYNIMSIPTLMVVKDGKVVNTAVGLQSKAALLHMLGKYCNSSLAYSWRLFSALHENLPA